MARAKFIDCPEFTLALQKLSGGTTEIAEKALRAGAGVIADQVRRGLTGILSQKNTGQLLDSFGITPVKQRADFSYDAAIGFDGYQKPGCGKFKSTGVPFQLIARSFESGAVMGGRYRDADGNYTRSKKNMFKPSASDYWRPKTPFFAPAVQASRAKAEAEMMRVANEEINKLTEGCNG